MLQIYIDERIIKRDTVIKFLGVYLDENIAWKHIDHLWKFFDISTTPHMSKCKLYDSLVTREGKSLKSYGTTAMVKHLRLKHSKKLELAWKKKVQSFPSISETSVASTTTTPFSIVEDTGFNELIKDAYPNYKLPCRTYFSQNIIPSMYDELFEDIKKKISAANYLSLTTDIWTADTAKIAFLSITGHLIYSTKFSQETAVLRVIHFPENQTGVHIKEYLQKGLESFEIPLSKIHLIVTDNASSIKAARNKFDHLPTACAKLKSIQQQLSTEAHKMKQDVPTRWNSSFEMLQRTFEDASKEMQGAQDVVDSDDVPIVKAPASTGAFTIGAL
ncbi:zinc finger BED domain-containing protein 4-like [Hydra vulgaris]|uniref:Zinc finger BED domain-containing protein 4-like n=1 Tax=Hydra vulgaris TaxID=6087 RepID=A0ABM4D124_HYDVU